MAAVSLMLLATGPSPAVAESSAAQGPGAGEESSPAPSADSLPPQRWTGTQPAAAVDGQIAVGPEQAAWDTNLRMLRVSVVFPDQPPARSLLRASGNRSVERQTLNHMVARGQAAGLHGVLYDNRDRGHSTIPAKVMPPRLTRVTYDAAAQAADIDYGLNERILFSAPTIGNASVALTSGPLRRSMPRLAMTRPEAMGPLTALYAANHLYVYPEHRDHDPGSADRFPANIPYLVISQGSSGSDRAFVTGLLNALEALKPRTAERLRDLGLIAPTLQMLLRRAMTGIDSDEDYLSGKAHPTVFAGEALRQDRLIQVANAIESDALPPFATLRVRREQAQGPTPDPFATLEQERLFDTPFAVSRVAKGPALLRRYEIEAAGHDADGRPVRLHWRVLRGTDVRIVPADATGRLVRVDVPWQSAAPVPRVVAATPPTQAETGGAEEPVTSTRVDIGVFADNGVMLSAPSIFSVYFPEDRSIVRTETGLPAAIEYDTAASQTGYIDPLLSPIRPWRDEFAYAPDGSHIGRVRATGRERIELCRLGHQVLTRDALGRPLLVETLDYRLEEQRGFSRSGRRTVVFAPSAKRLLYRYRDAQDHTGEAEPVP